MQGPSTSVRVLGGIGVLLLAILTGCASRAPGSGGDAAGGTPAGQRDQVIDLTIEVDAGDGSAPSSWTLVCADPARGTHPDPAAACAHLQGLDEPFAPIPGDVVCTEQFGGPQTAHVTGVWHGEPVDVELSRTDGCRISQWDGLGPLLPIDVG